MSRKVLGRKERKDIINDIKDNVNANIKDKINTEPNDIVILGDNKKETEPINLKEYHNKNIKKRNSSQLDYYYRNKDRILNGLKLKRKSKKLNKLKELENEMLKDNAKNDIKDNNTIITE